MEFETLQIKAAITPSIRENFNGLSSREVMKILLERGYKTMLLKGSFIEDFSDGIFLYVELDALFLLTSYFSLEELLETGHPYQHGVYLNDGLLSIMAESDRRKVKVKFEYCPDLNIKSLCIHHLIVNENEYVLWWRSIAHELANYLSVH